MGCPPPTEIDPRSPQHGGLGQLPASKQAGFTFGSTWNSQKGLFLGGNLGLRNLLQEVLQEPPDFGGHLASFL